MKFVGGSAEGKSKVVDDVKNGKERAIGSLVGGAHEKDAGPGQSAAGQPAPEKKDRGLVVPVSSGHLS